MDDQEFEHMDDELEEQFIPLSSKEEDKASSPRPFRFSTPQVPPGKGTLILRFSVILSLLLLFLLVFPGSFPTLRTLTVDFISSLRPAPTTTSSANANNFYFDTTLPWTQVFVDNQALHVPQISVDAPIKLAPGHHLIQWQANPFPLQSCLLTLPYSSENTCLINEMTSYDSKYPAHLIMLHESLTSLSSDQWNQLYASVQATLKAYTFEDTVQPGQSYRLTSGFATATQPLQASLHFQWDTWTVDGKNYVVTLQGCEALCSLPWQLREAHTALLTGSEWLAASIVTTSWDYRTQTGQVIALNQPGDIRGANESSHPVLLGLNWDGTQWNVKMLFNPEIGLPLTIENVMYTDDPACIAAQSLLTGMLPLNAQVRFSSALFNAARGCLVKVTSPKQNTASSPATAYYFEHFGVLLAVNDAAHQALPQLRQASPSETALALQLDAYPGQTIQITTSQTTLTS